MIGKQRIVALVPMKEHSERVPHKNVRPFLAEPLYFRILRSLVNCPSIDEIVINTDSSQISTEAPKHFPVVRIISRPEHLRGDDISMNRVLAHDLDQSDGDIYLQTHSTNPLLRSETIQKAITAFAQAPDHDSLLSVNRYQSRFYDHNRNPINHDPGRLLRTQDLSPIYEENSCLYVFTKNSFAKANARIGQRPLFFETPLMESIDIDTEEMWELAEAVAVGLVNIGRRNVGMAKG